MGLSGSDIATNSAGVALMNDDLRRVPFLLELAQRTRNLIAQNILVCLIAAVIGLALAATGRLTLFLVLVWYLIPFIFVIANSFRLVRFGEEFTEAEEAMRRLEASRIVKPTRRGLQPQAAT